MLTALVVDDEPLARTRLRRLLESQGVEVLGEAEDAADGLQLVEALKPDMLFLDIQMPDLTGIQAASALLYLASAPAIVFVTGYSEYAVTAFEQRAMDYLVKPVSQERLALTLARAREDIAAKQARLQADKELSPSAPATPPLRSLPVRVDYAVRFLPLREILCAVSRNRQTYVVTQESEFRLHYSLTHLEAILPSEHFLRIHDSSLVNVDKIIELHFLGDHTYEVRLSNKQLLRVGRSRYPELQRRMGISHLPMA